MPWDLCGDWDPPVWHKHPLNRYRRQRTGRLLEGLRPRYSWAAQMPKSTERINNRAPAFMAWPPAGYANHVHFTHTATQECQGDDCVPVLKDQQQKHLDQGEPDIRHSFMISTDGQIFVGRGWDTMCNIPEDFTTFYTASLEIALIGDFSKTKPPKNMVKTVKRLTDWGIVNLKLYCCYDKTYDYDLFNMYFGKCQ